MAKTTQTIGDITGSKHVDIKQAATDSAEQSIGKISSASDIRLAQIAVDPSRKNLLEIANLLSGLDGEQSNAVANELRHLFAKTAPDAVVSYDALRNVIEQVLPPAMETPTAAAVLRDASSALGLVSGGIAIAQLTNPYLLAIAAPAALVATGLMQTDMLSTIYGRIRQLLQKIRGHK